MHLDKSVVRGLIRLCMTPNQINLQTESHLRTRSHSPELIKLIR